MKVTDSHECRSCHAFESMDETEQTKFSRKKHAKAELEGKHALIVIGVQPMKCPLSLANKVFNCYFHNT